MARKLDQNVNLKDHAFPQFPIDNNEVFLIDTGQSRREWNCTDEEDNSREIRW